MASSSETSTSVIALLRAIQEEGNMAQLLHHLSNGLSMPAVTEPNDFILVSDGAMTDASKRRLTESSEDHQGPPPKQAPVTPGSKLPDALPEGIQDLAHWGHTILTVSKYGKERMTYRPLRRISKNTWLGS